MQGGNVGEAGEGAERTWVQAAKGVQDGEHGVDLSCERSVGEDVGKWCKSCSLDAVDDIWKVVWDWDDLNLHGCVSKDTRSLDRNYDGLQCSGQWSQEKDQPQAR